MTARRTPTDHFSVVSAGYAAYRPRYPLALFEAVVPLAPRRRLAWDCAAGSGQATIDLANWFDHVIATDMSLSQISSAPEHPKVTWYVAKAEQSKIASDTVDFIAVAQALHWFDQAAFFAEARRVAAPDGILAVWSYGSIEIDGELGRAVSHFEHDSLGQYWPAERNYVNELYATIRFPFDEIRVPPVQMEEHWTQQQLLGYMRTWSARSRYMATNGKDPVDEFEHDVAKLWRDADTPRTMRWPLTIRVGRVTKH
ncbi:MAG TPA: class I SAM-dependent methyltransferase [Gemmatimonadaceae bacterium]|jgi:SAM-dependent methyltransferase|nr:class I SAM-dependent methyltransferase [Gemmatimonadaceae bacterium]